MFEAIYDGLLKKEKEGEISRRQYNVRLFLLLYVPSQQLWSLRDGQFT